MTTPVDSPPRVLVDTNAAAAAVGRRPGTIRAWGSAGELEKIGKDRRGRVLYDLEQVQRVAREHAERDPSG